MKFRTTIRTYKLILYMLNISIVHTLAHDCNIKHNAPQSRAPKQVYTQQPPYIFINSIPKCGTHLLINCLKVLTKKTGYFDPAGLKNKLPHDHKKFYVHHLAYSPQAVAAFANNNYKGLFIYRDPRDHLVSFVFHAYTYKKNFPELAQLNFDDAFSRILTHGTDKAWEGGAMPLNDYYRLYMQWKNVPFVYTIKFEDLVGAQGGGDNKKQAETIKNICRHLGITLSPRLIIKTMSSIYGNSTTFRKGIVGDWKNHFKPYHKELFKAHAGQLLIDLGYEKDFTW